MSYFSTEDSYEKVYLSFDPMHRLMQERNITDLQLARKVGVKIDVPILGSLTFFAEDFEHLAEYIKEA